MTTICISNTLASLHLTGMVGIVIATVLVEEAMSVHADKVTVAHVVATALVTMAHILATTVQAVEAMEEAAL